MANHRLVSLVVVAIIGCASAASTIDYSPEALKQQITDLPGIPAGVNFKMFSGYIPINADGSKQIFYWFVESQSNPATDPLLLWTNGGPGCSGLGGFFTENGPFRPTAQGNLTMNPHAWNQVANMVFIEQPAGVGFSYTTEPMKYGDSEAAADNYAFVLAFLKKFSSFASHDFYLTSESYGGHYLPTLAKLMVDDGGVPTFKGFMVGNPYTWMVYTNYGQYGTWYGHQLIPKPLWESYLKAACGAPSPGTAASCNAIENEMNELTSGLDPYALDFPICTTPQQANEREQIHTLLTHIARAKAATRGDVGNRNLQETSYWPANYQPCNGNWAQTYLNRADVVAAIGAKLPAGGWTDCANLNWNATSAAAPMMPVWNYLLAKGGLKLLIYSGDDDSVCPTMDSQQYIWNLGTKKVLSPWAPWMMEGQVSGYYTQFDGFSFVTVHGAGHLVPQTRPAQSLVVLKNYLSGKW